MRRGGVHVGHVGQVATCGVEKAVVLCRCVSPLCSSVSKKLTEWIPADSSGIYVAGAVSAKR